jgi:hypothetical protein
MKKILIGFITWIALIAGLALMGCSFHKKPKTVDIPDFSIVIPGRCVEKLIATPDTYCRMHNGEFTCYRIRPVLKSECNQEGMN